MINLMILILTAIPPIQLLSITIPFYVWIIGIIGIISVIINFIRLLTKVNQPLTLESNANLKQLPKDDPLYHSFLKIENQPIDQAYQTCFNQHQLVLINNYLPTIIFSIGLTIIPIVYLISEWIIMNEWNDSWLIFISVSILPLSWMMAFTTRIYSLIFYGLLLNWSIYAVSLSGHPLPPDTLLFFAILIYFISLSIILIVGYQKNQQKSNSLLGLIAWSVLIVFALSIIRYFLPFLGSFTILLVVPLILMACLIKGCIFSVLALPILILSALTERYFLQFPNSLLISIFFSLDIALLLLILAASADMKQLFNQLSQHLDMTHPNEILFPCQICEFGMQYIPQSEIDNYLSDPQQIARSIDSMQYLAWRCPHCYPSASIIHLRGYIQRKKSSPLGSWFEDCPTCEEQTMICHRTLIEQSRSHFAGMTIHHQNFNIERNCACCHLTDSRNASEHHIS